MVRSSLLAPSAPRSERDLDLEAASASARITVHPFTGAFANPSHESAFAAQLFRLAFPCHTLLMGLTLAVNIGLALMTPPDTGKRAFRGIFVLGPALSLVGRVLLHRMHDLVRSQRIGSWTWTILLVLHHVTNTSGYVTAPAKVCALTWLDMKYLIVYPLVDLAVAILNWTHGMGCLHKTVLIGIMLADSLVAIAVCGEAALAVALCDMGALLLGSVVAHMAELYLRHSYAEKEDKRRQKEKVDEDKRRLEERNEQLQAEKERLLYDGQRRGRPIDDDDRTPRH